MAMIRETLGELKPCWKGRFQPDHKERDLFAHAGKGLRFREVISLAALRRIGKATLFHTIVRNAIRASVGPGSSGANAARRRFNPLVPPRSVRGSRSPIAPSSS